MSVSMLLRKAGRALVRKVGRTPVVLAGVGVAGLGLGGGALAATGGGTQAPGGLSVGRAVGQMIVTGFSGRTAPASVLARIRDGHVGGVILFGGNTVGGQAATLRLVMSLQAAAAAGHQPGLLVMTDQEGGEVKRLPGPPEFSAAEMTTASRAGQQGLATGHYLVGAGVNVDLAPVADVRRNTNGFLAVEQRTFGSTAGEVASRACAFAEGLGSAGVVSTFKHFPGLGRAVESTDTGPVTIDASASAIRADDEAYRTCADATRTPSLVMVSSAIYPKLTGGHLPAVLSPEIYAHELPVEDHVSAPTISDDLGAGALAKLPNVAQTAIDAGLDMLLYATDGGSVGHVYATLVAGVQSGAVSRSRVEAAAASILAVKHALGLPNT
jgi:beta-N-acetylhexosaminidase